jgi:hypothetical protein
MPCPFSCRFTGVHYGTEFIFLPNDHAVTFWKREMAVYRYVNVHLPSPNAKRLADLCGIANDLQSCRAYCEEYVKTFASILKPTHDVRHLESFCMHVFVKYGRCFCGGVRTEVAKRALSSLSPEDKTFHQLVMDVRNKHVAHSVNNFESHKLRVWLNPEEKGRNINGVSIETDYFVAPECQFFERLMSLIDKLLSWISTEQKREEKMLIGLVGDHYSLDELYALDAEVPEPVDYSNVARRRGCP